MATLRPLFFLALHRLGLSTAPTGRRPSNYGGLSGQKLGGPALDSKGDKLRPDTYKMSNVVESRPSHDDGPREREKEMPKSPHWFNNAYPPAPPPKDKMPKETKKLKKTQPDNDSEKSFKLKASASRSSDELDDGINGIMVSKSFYITDEEPTTARKGPLA